MSFNSKSAWWLATDLDPLFNADALPSRFKGASVYNAWKSDHIASRDWSLTVDPFYISTVWRCLRWDGRVLANTSVIIGYKRKVCPLQFPLRVNLNPLYIGSCQPRSEISTMSRRRTAKDKLSSERQDSSKKSSRVVKSKKFIRPAPSNVFQSIEITQPLSDNEATTISCLSRHSLAKGLSESLQVPVRADDLYCSQYSSSYMQTKAYFIRFA